MKHIDKFEVICTPEFSGNVYLLKLTPPYTFNIFTAVFQTFNYYYNNKQRPNFVQAYIGMESVDFGVEVELIEFCLENIKEFNQYTDLRYNTHYTKNRLSLFLIQLLSDV